MTDSVVVEGYARLRDGKKWKTRWIVLRKPSPVADCLVLLVYKDKTERAQGNRERASVTLEEICGLETGQCFEGVTFTLTVLCLNQCALLGFDTKEALLGWEARLRYSLGEVHRFFVAVLPGTKLETGPATLHLCNNLLALARDVPPVIIGHWNLPDLRRYGPVPNGFVFEGGTRCGYWAGVFLLASGESEQISFLFDCVVRGISPTRGPFGLKPVLPDLSLNQINSEEKLNHEAEELEKRLSMLSHRSSTISSTYCPSAGGDDRSISGSSDTSDTSQSDCSIGSRLVIWSDLAPTENSAQLTPKCPALSTEKLSVTPGGVTRPAVKAPRQLQEIGRQSSSDSGIATGSHSSYTGSFSSYTGSLDIQPTEDYGTPPHLTQDLSPCTCPSAPGHEYQVPNSLRYLYDTPRSILQDATSTSEPSVPNDDRTESSGASAETERQDSTSQNHTEPKEIQTVTDQTEESQKHKVAPSSDSQHPDSCHICSPPATSASKTIVTICSTCGGFKVSPCIPPSGATTQPVPDKRPFGQEQRRRADYEVMEGRTLEKNSEGEEKSKYELMGSCGHQRFFQESEGSIFIFPPEAAVTDRLRSDAVTYVNIPVSPTSKKQLNYMELELQETGSGPRGTTQHLPAQRKCSTKYAQIDITATETAHKVGTQHALGRQEGLLTLELRRKATPH